MGAGFLPELVLEALEAGRAGDLAGFLAACFLVVDARRTGALLTSFFEDAREAGLEVAARFILAFLELARDGALEAALEAGFDFGFEAFLSVLGSALAREDLLVVVAAFFTCFLAAGFLGTAFLGVALRDSLPSKATPSMILGMGSLSLSD